MIRETNPLTMNIFIRDPHLLTSFKMANLEISGNIEIFRLLMRKFPEWHGDTCNRNLCITNGYIHEAGTLNQRPGVSNRLELECLFDSLFKITIDNNHFLHYCHSVKANHGAVKKEVIIDKYPLYNMMCICLITVSTRWENITTLLHPSIYERC